MAGLSGIAARPFRGASKTGRPAQAFAILCALALVALLWLGLLVHLSLRKDTVLAQTRADVTNLSIAIAEQVGRMIEGVDQVMRFVQADHDTDPDSFDFAAWVKRANSLDDLAVQIALFADNGDLIAAKVPPSLDLGRVNVADRAYFRHLADHPAAGLVVARTMKGRIQQRWALQLARRLNTPDGRFAGAIVVSVDPDYIARRFSALDVGRDGSIALFGEDGYVRARWPESPGMYEIDASNMLQGAGLFGELKRAPVGTYAVRSTFDGVSRVFGYRSLANLPLIVTVGKSTDEVLAAFHAEEARAVAVGVVMTAVILTGLVFLLRELERRRRREAELVEAHAAIAQSEARYRLLADHATDMIVQLDRAGRRVFVSPAARHLLGHEPDELLGTNPADYVHPEDRAAFVETMAALVRGERRSAISSHRFRHRDGHYIWVEASWQAIRDGEDRLTGFVAAVRDISARREAESALRESEAQYHMLADALPQLAWLTRASDGVATYVNRQFEDYCGPIGRDRAARAALMHPDDVERMMALWREAEATGEGLEAELRLRRHDGAYRWHKIVLVPVRQKGEVAGWLATALDIDDIIEARSALEETSDLLRLAQAGAGAGSWDFDLVSGQVVLSPESALMHGMSGDGPATMPIETWQTIARQEDAAETMRLVRQAIETRTTFETEFRIVQLDGSTRWLHGIGRTYYDASGRARRMIGLNFDITARKDAEFALLQAKDAAEAAKLEAERASAAKTDFLASMSHEIRTPLNAIIGFTDLLAGSGRLPPDLRRQAELARSSGSALLTIVNDILDFSEVEAGRIELESHSFAPAALIDNCLSILRDGANAKSLSLRESVDPGLPSILLGDEARLRQVLLNLLNNAVKFTRQGSVTLDVRYDGADASGERVRFSVADTGIGIPTDKQHRLFERFSQIDGSIRRDFGGTGLGLAICKRLIDMMGGQIGFVSEEGKGTTFWFSLSLPRGNAATAPAIVAERLIARRTGRLLLVEDVAINQELACAVLEAAGHVVDVVDDGEAAVAAVQAAAYDLVLMDVQMPGMDGMTATRLIRGLPGPERDVPIVAMTANVLPGEVEQFRKAGMDDHVGKPFNRADLYAVIDRWLAGRPVGQRLAEPARARRQGPDCLDRAIFDDLLDLHGADGAVRLLGYFDAELTQSFAGAAASEDDRVRLRREAHVLVSAAGMLGFTALSRACTELEACDAAQVADQGAAAFERALIRVRSAASAAAAESRRLKAELRGEDRRAARAGSR